MKAIDTRLLSIARGILPMLGGGAFLGLLRGLAILAWSWAIAHLIALSVASLLEFDVPGEAIGRVFEGLPARSHWVPLTVLALVAISVRSASSWLIGLVSERGAGVAKHALRERALTRMGELGPGWIEHQSESDLTVKLGRGLDALDNYFAQYIPQLLLTIAVTPMLVLALFFADPLSAIIVVIVFPIIPVFMVLIGLATRGSQEQQWGALKQLSSAYLDAIRGLPTLKLFRRQQRQVDRVRHVAGQYRSRTMKVLRVTFLSGFVLDLAGTFSVALVAVTVGTRLVSGEFPLALGLFVLLLVPEVFVPIRQVGAAYHASTEGLTAVEEVLAVIDAPDAASKQPKPVPDNEAGTVLCLDAVQPVRDGAPVAQAITATVHRGEFIGVAGPSGVGKSSLIAAVLGLAPFIGEIRVTNRIAWSGQRPGLLQGTIASNLTLGESHVPDSLMRAALADASLADVPLETPLGPSGRGLSGGQAQRVALARALLRVAHRDADLLLLDEPTSALDRDTERAIIASLRRVADRGTAVVVVSHRAEVLSAADRIITIEEAVSADATV